MERNLAITPPFFEIGPKNYLYGQDVIELAIVAAEASRKHRVKVIFTTPYVNIADVARSVANLYVFAPHMDAIPVGRGLAHILPEAVKAAGASGVMLNHTEKPLSLSELCTTLGRARRLSLMTIVCAGSLAETKAVAVLSPDIILSEPAELIGTGVTAGSDYIQMAMEAVCAVNPNIGLMVSAGISSGNDTYSAILAGADATGSSSGIVKAKDPPAMIFEMLAGVRQAWDERMARKSR